MCPFAQEEGFLGAPEDFFSLPIGPQWITSHCFLCNGREKRVEGKKVKFLCFRY